MRPSAIGSSDGRGGDEWIGDGRLGDARGEEAGVGVQVDSAIDLRVPTAEHLRALWLDGFPDGGMFVPGLVSVPAAATVIVRVAIEGPRPATTFLRGTVAWRRLQAGSGAASMATSGMLLRAGSGVAFDASMRPRLLFLERMERGAAGDARTSSRYPAHLAGELMVRDGDLALPVRVDDVGSRGARVRLPSKAIVAGASVVRLWLGCDGSGASSFAPLAGRVVWIDRARGDNLGVQLDLGSKEDRLHWARVFSRCQQEFERHFVPPDRRVG